nr:MAG TPA: hypothetical protein [Caudoviricetes sp.]
MLSTTAAAFTLFTFFSTLLFFFVIKLLSYRF